MATAKLHRISDSGKSALILVRKNKFEFSASPAYIPAAAVADLEAGESFELPDGFEFVPMMDEDGNPYTTKDGQPLHCLKW